MMQLLKTTSLFAITALAEILGCYLPWLVLKQGRPMWLLMPAAVSLALFAWLLTLHPFAAGRTSGVRQFRPKNDDFGEVAPAFMRVSARFF